jgi:hypothetical protein
MKPQSVEANRNLDYTYNHIDLNKTIAGFEPYQSIKSVKSVSTKCNTATVA